MTFFLFWNIKTFLDKKKQNKQKNNGSAPMFFVFVFSRTFIKTTVVFRRRKKVIQVWKDMRVSKLPTFYF